MNRTSAFLGLSLAAVGLFLTPERAEACGGCFIIVQDSTSTVVTGHRMAVSISPSQTVLWDQIQYTGDPAEFAWVLPVMPGARIEVGEQAFFDALEVGTAPRVQSPPVFCGTSGGSGCGFGCSATMSAGGGGPPVDEGDPVTVVSQSVIGPYETVTLSTDTPGALNTWLSDHGYAIDASIQPVVDAYVAEGFDFIALRLAPGQGVRAMQPVRVVTAGASPAFPLRMVAAGTGATTDIVLYVISEGRWWAQGFLDVDVDPTQLVWNFDDSSSNFATLRQAALAQNEGRSFFTPFAQRGALLRPGTGQYLVDEATGTYASSLPEVYGRLLGQSSGCPSLNANADSQWVVVDDCDADGNCVPVAAGQNAASEFQCAGGTDFARALVGLHPSDVWVTRLEASLPRAALDGDLVLAAAPQQVERFGVFQASSYSGKDPCTASVLGAPRLAPQTRDALAGLGALFVSAGVLLSRRRRRATAADA